MKNREKQNAQENTQARGLRGAIKGAKDRTIAAANKVTARDGAMVAVGAVSAVGVGLGIRAYKNHKANQNTLAFDDVREDRRRVAAE